MATSGPFDSPDPRARGVPGYGSPDQGPSGSPGSPGSPGYGPPPWHQQQPPGPPPSWGPQQPWDAQQSWGPPGHGAAGAAPYGGPPALPARPQELELSFRLWIGSVVLGLIGSVVALSTLGSLTDTLAAAGGGPGTGVAAQAVTVGIVVGAVFGIAVVVLQVVLAVLLRRGRNWARITLAVLGGLAVLAALVGTVTPSTTRINGQVIETGSTLSTVLSLVQALVIVAAIVVSFRPEANRYVAAVSAGAR